MAENFTYDVFLSHSSKDKRVAREVAERLRADGLRVWLREWEIALLATGSRRAKKVEEGLEGARMLVLCISANSFGDDWAEMEAGTLRFRDPLNKERRFILLRIDSIPIKDSLTQFLCINWLPDVRQLEYGKLLEACRPPQNKSAADAGAVSLSIAPRTIDLNAGYVRTGALAPDGERMLIAKSEGLIQLWDLKTKRCVRTFEGHGDDGDGFIWGLAWRSDQSCFLSCAQDKEVRLWDVESGRCLRAFKGHTGPVLGAAWSPDNRHFISYGWPWGGDSMRLWDADTGEFLWGLEGDGNLTTQVVWSADERFVLSCSINSTLRLWDVETRRCLRVFEGHTDRVNSIAWSHDGHLILSGSEDKTLRLWEVETGRCLRVLEGHTMGVTSVAWIGKARLALSGSVDTTVRLWEVERGICLCEFKAHTSEVISVLLSTNHPHAFSVDSSGSIGVWDLAAFVTDVPALGGRTLGSLAALEQVQYMNAKILVVGESGAGKSRLTERLALERWVARDDESTVGAWSTQWPLPGLPKDTSTEREIWLWDFGGQADQRLIHQLFMDKSNLILLLFNADCEEVLPGLREWQQALSRSVPSEAKKLLVAGRIDAGFRAHRAKIEAFARANGYSYHETSAREGWGCNELRETILKSIPWDRIERRTSPRIFKSIRDEIVRLRDQEQVLFTFKELREVLWHRLPEKEGFTDEALGTVLGLLDGPGVVKELNFGTYILLKPEWINAYAQAVIRTLRDDPAGLGCLPLRGIAEGQLIFQARQADGEVREEKRLPRQEEAIVLQAMEEELLKRTLCLRQDDKLVFPSHCGRERPVAPNRPPILVSYRFQGFLDDVYAALVVKLAYCGAFRLKELWRDAADFETLAERRLMGVKLTREADGRGEVAVYFAPQVAPQEQVIFASYVHQHLKEKATQVARLRHYVCRHCGTPAGNPEVAMRKLAEGKKDMPCVNCDDPEKRILLWDEMEECFASEEVREQVRLLHAEGNRELDARRLGKLLVNEVSARITSADQKCYEIPGTEDEGLDVVLEFTDEEGRGTGKRLYLQLKAGNSHLRWRKRDNAEVFDIAKPRWVEYWQIQDAPVMLVIGTLPEKGKEGLERGGQERFADIRWMEISSYLQRESRGKKQVKEIVFKGERLDVMSVRRWRDKLRGGAA